LPRCGFSVVQHSSQVFSEHPDSVLMARTPPREWEHHRAGAALGERDNAESSDRQLFQR